jgi:REP element-mobilizing transposase RayT
MGRPLRIEYEGAVYHITSRGNERRKVFIDKEDREKFLDILREYHERFKAIFHCFVLMDDHYHLLLETPSGNLVTIMHGINGRYTGYFNRRHARIGHLFQGRYRAILVEKEAYLLELNRYIHLNPVRAGICKRPEDYLWSSYRGYINPQKRLPWIEYDWMLDQFAKKRMEARKRYEGFVKEGLSKGVPNPLEEVRGGIILGKKFFFDKIRKSFKDKAINEEIVRRKQLREFISPEEVIKLVCDYYKLPPEDLRKRKKNHFPKNLAIYLIYKLGQFSNREIASLFGGMHYSAISHGVRRLREAMKRNRKLCFEIEELENKLKRY